MPTAFPLRHSLLAGACLALCQSATYAQNTLDVEQLLDLSLEDLIALPVVTASRKAETRDQTPAHIVVITREQIQSRRYMNLADLLEDLPGVDFQRGTKTSQYNQFSVQGYVSPNKLLVMMDGIRIGHPGGGNFPVAENLDLYPAKQVEVLFGPAAALYGADAVSGVVNIITDKAGEGGSYASVGAGRFGQKRASFLTSTRTENGLGLSIGGHSQHSQRASLDQYYPSHYRPVDGVFGGNVVLPADQREPYAGGIRSHSLFARLDWQDKFTVGAYRYHFNSLTSTGDPMVTAKLDADAQWRTTVDTVYARYRYELGENVQAELTLDHSRLEVDPRAFYNNVYNGFTRGYSYVQGERTGIEQRFDWHINNQHQVQAGLGWQKFYDIEAASLPSPYQPSKSPSQQGMLYPNTDLPLIPMDASFHNASAYAQWQAQWSDAWSTTAGVRVDKHSAYGSSVNPRMGLVYKPSQQHVFKALYGQAFRAPSPEESLTSYGSFDGSRDEQERYIGTNFRVPNLNLEPEKVRSLSLVWDWRPSSNVNLVANLYHSRISNLVVNGNLDDLITEEAIIRQPDTKANAGRQRQTGLDLSAQWRFKLGGEWTGDAWGSASWIRGRLDNGDGVDWSIPYVASRKVKLGTTLRWRNSFSITPVLRWTGPVTNGRTKAPGNALLPPAACSGSMSAPSRCRTPGYTVMDLHLGWHQLLGGKANLWLDVHNLLDKRHYAAAGSGSLTFWDMPQQPRSWMITLDYKF